MPQPEFAVQPDTAPSRAGSLVSRQATISPVVELRQYTLHPGARETLIDIFDRHFVEPQEAAGMTVIGQFRDVDRPDMFVWLRGFPDMESRRKSLEEFYGGPVWTAHRDTANATMIDSDDVLLLRPAWEGSGFDLTEARCPAPMGRDLAAPSSFEDDPGALMATIWHLAPGTEDDFVSCFHREAMPLLVSLGARTVAAFVTEHAENTFPRLPVRVGENVFVAFARFSDAAALENHRKALAGSPEWRAFLAKARNWFSKPVELLRLTPTARSRLR